MKKAGDEEAPMRIGEKLRFARDRVGLTLAEVRERTKLGESSISDFENDKRSPSLSQLDQLARCYGRSISFFFEEAPPPLDVVLWRKRPEEHVGEIEVQFTRLAEQYHNLEVWCESRISLRLPTLPVGARSFGLRDAEELAKDVRREMELGNRPSFELLRALEEDCGVKVFHLPFDPKGSAACTKSSKHGAAILLNSKSSRWRRNFDLAHELFHILSWDLYRQDQAWTSTEDEEKLANAFASHLLLPTDAVRTAVSRRLTGGDKLSHDALFDIARDFDVSAEAILWRVHMLYRRSLSQTQREIKSANSHAWLYEERMQEQPPSRPPRFHALAVRALRRGEVSVGRFAEYLGISRREAMPYVEQEVALDEAIELPAV